MVGNIEHELVQRREGLDIRNDGRLLAALQFPGVLQGEKQYI